jgi:hypothetical protein
MCDDEIVHVALLGEGTVVWRPVAAQPISPGLFRLIGPIPEGERWEFQPDEVVRCERRTLSNGTRAVVAIQRDESNG